MRIKSGIWSIEVANRCCRCQTELLDDKSILCENCRLLQQGFEFQSRTEEQANREIDRVVREASLGVDVIQTSGITYYTTNRVRCQNISGVVFETGKSVREIHYILGKLGLPRRYDPLKHHALIFTYEEVERIKKCAIRPGHVIINSVDFVSTSHLSLIIGDTRQSINKHARDGDWTTVLMSGERWNQVQGIEDYLTSKQRRRDVVALRRDTVRSCSGQNVPRVELWSPSQPHSLLTESRSSVVASEDANCPSHTP